MWLCEKESILTEKLENIKKEKQKAIVKNVGIKCGFMVSCGKDIYMCPFFSCKYGKREYHSCMYIVFLLPFAVNIFILIIAD